MLLVVRKLIQKSLRNLGILTQPVTQEPGSTALPLRNLALTFSSRTSSGSRLALQTGNLQKYFQPSKMLGRNPRCSKNPCDILLCKLDQIVKWDPSLRRILYFYSQKMGQSFSESWSEELGSINLHMALYTKKYRDLVTAQGEVIDQ